jgi:hypothetical protein
MARRGEKTRAGNTWSEALLPELLNEFQGCAESGKLSRRKTGKEAGSVANTGYRQVTWAGFAKFGMCKVQLVHRVLFFMYHKEVPPMIDHINGIRTDNRKCNLRPADSRSNQLNRHVKVGKSQDLPIGVYRRYRKGRTGLWYEVKYENDGTRKSTYLRNKDDAVARIKLWRETYG